MAPIPCMPCLKLVLSAAILLLLNRNLCHVQSPRWRFALDDPLSAAASPLLFGALPNHPPESFDGVLVVRPLHAVFVMRCCWYLGDCDMHFVSFWGSWAWGWSGTGSGT